MEIFLQQVFSGIAIGSIYAIFALSLVMIYLALGHINFAQGEMGMFSTFIAWWLMEQGMLFWPAFFLTIILSFLGGMVLERIVFRPFERMDVFAQIMVFIGLLLILKGLAGWIFGYLPKVFPAAFSETIFPHAKYVTSHEIGILIITMAVMAVLTLFSRFTKLGLMMRATASNPQLSRLVGIHLGRMLALAWGVAAAISAISGMLIAPSIFLDPNMMTDVFFYAITAAAFGGFTNPIITVIGGIFLGVIENLIGTYFPFIGSELKVPVAFVIIVIIFMCRPKRVYA